MMKRLAVVVIALALVGCARKEPPRQAPKRRGPILTPDQIPRRDFPSNLLDIAHGSVVVHRTGEHALTSSAFHGIDSDIYSAWTSPPNDVRQSVTVRLGARSRIERVGVDFPSAPLPPFAVRRALFEISDDGISFRPLTRQTVEKAPARQLVNVSPSEANYVRFTIEETFGDRSASGVPEILAEGTETERWNRPRVTGAWQLNNMTAALAEDRGRITGSISMNPPMHLEGGWEGRMIRFFWSRPNHEWGYGLFTVAPDGKAINGVYWNESPISPFLGTVWFGERIESAESPESPDVFHEWLERFGRAPLYALSWDGDALDVARSEPAVARIASNIEAHPRTHFSMTAYEFRDPDVEHDRQKATARLNALAAALRARGADMSRIELNAAGNVKGTIQNDEMQRAIFSRIELQRR